MCMCMCMCMCVGVGVCVFVCMYTTHKITHRNTQTSRISSSDASEEGPAYVTAREFVDTTLASILEERALGAAKYNMREKRWSKIWKRRFDGGTNFALVGADVIARESIRAGFVLWRSSTMGIVAALVFTGAPPLWIDLSAAQSSSASCGGVRQVCTQSNANPKPHTKIRAQTHNCQSHLRIRSR